MLRVRVVGAIELELDGEPRDPPSGRPARMLLGWLATHHGSHPRSTLAAALWPDVRDDSARASLRTALSALRDAFGTATDSALMADRHIVGLADWPAVVVDLREFDERLAAGEPAAALAAVAAGDVLPGLEADWVLRERDRHRDGVSQAMAEIAAGASADGDQGLALIWLRRRADLDPFDEPAHRELMSALDRCGDRSGAIAVYERLTQRLRKELAVAPSAATRSLGTALRFDADGPQAGEPAAPAPPLPAGLERRRFRRMFVGRARELSRLSATWARARAGGFELAVLVGEPGIGKSRVAAEFAAEIHGTGATVLFAAADEDSVLPCQPVIEALRGAAGPGEDLSGGTGPIDGAAARLRLQERLARGLEEVAQGRPLLLVLDDLHWADAETLAFLSRLARRGVAVPAMVIATARRGALEPSGPPGKTMAAVARHAAIETIELDGLSLSEGAALIGDAAKRPGLIEALVARTQGNPFFIEALLDAGLPDVGSKLPAGIAELVASRLQTLGAEVDEMLQIAAVLGRAFDVTLALRASSLDVEAARGALDRAAAAHLVEPVRGRADQMTFVHALVQEAMVSRPAPGRLAALHARAVSALGDDVRGGSEVALTAAARHALAAVPSISIEHMAELVERAGSALTAAHAPADAVELLSRAQSLCEEGGAPVRVLVAVRLALGEALRACDRHEQASGVFEAALSQALRLGDGPSVARATLGLLGPVVSVGRSDREAVATLEAALDALGGQAPALRARVEARLAIELAYDRDDGRRDGLTERALVAARALGDPRARAEALGARHVALWGPDHTVQRLPIAEEMLALARRLDDPVLELQARTWLIVDLEEVGEGAAVDAQIESYAATAARSGLSAYAWYVPAWRAARAYLEGRPQAARELQRRAARLGQEAGDPNAEFAARLQIVVTLADDTPADVDVEWLETKVRGSPAAWAYRCMFTWVLAACGRDREARLQLRAQGPAEWPRDTNWLSAAKERASAAVLLDDRRAGAEMEELLSPFADRLVVSARALMCMGSVAGTLATLAGLRGDRDAAIALYEQAIEREERAGARIWAMHHRLHLGEALAAAGASDQAAALLGVVAREASGMGVAQLAVRADRACRSVARDGGTETAR